MDQLLKDYIPPQLYHSPISSIFHWAVLIPLHLTTKSHILFSSSQHRSPSSVNETTLNLDGMHPVMLQCDDGDNLSSSSVFCVTVAR